MLGPQCLFPNLKSAPKQRLGFEQASLCSLELRKVVHGDCDVGMPRPQCLFQVLKSKSEQRLGLRVSRSQLGIETHLAEEAAGCREFEAVHCDPPGSCQGMWQEPLAEWPALKLDIRKSPLQSPHRPLRPATPVGLYEGISYDLLHQSMHTIRALPDIALDQRIPCQGREDYGGNERIRLSVSERRCQRRSKLTSTSR